MKYNELQVAANKDRIRAGRGIAAGRGKTAGRGTKGQGARTGKKLRATFQGGQNPLVQATPKAKGFKSLRKPAQVVYLDHLNDLAGETPFHKVKVISRGELNEKVTLKVQAASKSAIEAIEKAGGKFEKVATPLKKSVKEEK